MFLSLAGVLRTGAAVVMAQNLREGAKLVYGEAMHFVGDKSLPVWVHWKVCRNILVEFEKDGIVCFHCLFLVNNKGLSGAFYLSII